MLHIDYAKAKELLEQAVQERGEDYVYEPQTYMVCLYVHTEEDDSLTPGCGVGVALVNAGIPIQVVKNMNEVGSAGFAIRRLKEMGYLTFTDKGLELLKEFQYRQDRENPWGSSLEYAINKTNPEK